MGKEILKKIVFILGIVALAVSAAVAASSVVIDSFIGTFVTPSAAVAPGRTAVSATKVSESVRSAVSIYKKRAGLAGLDKVFLPSDEVGAGTVLTSDGWLLTSADALSGASQLVAVFADNTAVAIDPAKAIRDDATGLAFVKAGSQRLTVAAFGDDSALHASDPVFIDDAAGITSASVVSPRRLPVAAKFDYVESSEKLGRRIILSQKGPHGAPVVDAAGAVVAVNMGDGTAVPISFVTEVLRGIFRDGKIARPALGVRYISLDNVAGAQDAGLGATGALLASAGKSPAVVKGSPADIGGLKEDDVIVAVEHDRINDEVTLAERLQDYAPGAQLGLTVLRGGKQIKVSVTLK